MSLLSARRARVGAALAALAGLLLSVAMAPAAVGRTALGDDEYDPSIIGGSSISISEAPWQAALVYAGYNDFQGQFCGGTIVSSWEIVTAAHCVDDPDLGQLAPSQLRIVAGTSTLSTSRSTGVAVASITVHGEWDDVHYFHDIAIVRLATPLTLIDGVIEPIEIATTSPSAGDPVVVTGWGSTSRDQDAPVWPTKLRAATVQAVADSPCGAALSAHGSIFQPSTLCAASPTYSADTCQGDSGGPLTYFDENRWVLAGVTSWGVGCAEPSFPGVYSEVSYYASWIADRLTGSPQRVARISGDDRYATSIAISRAGFPDPVVSTPVVFIASGVNFPDALSAGPAAAALGGPLLLTSPTALPRSVAAEITRLNPDKIWVVGGTGAVSSRVYSALAGLAPDIDRVYGADRYATSRAVTRLGFTVNDDGGLPGASSAYIATGSGFADALAAGAAAGSAAAPVVLVPGSAPRADAATRALLSELGVTSIRVVGGTGAVSSSMYSSLNRVAPAQRLAGADRIASAVAVNAAAFESSEFVYLTNAYSFPDALAGGVLATVDPGPMFTVPSTCVPRSVLTAIRNLGAEEVRLLGGTGVLSVRVAHLRRC